VIGMLEVRGINVGYGNLQILWDVSFNIKEGEIVTIIGPNGAGKTTLLKAIAGLLKPKSGEIYFHGKQIGGLPAYKIVREGIALVPEGRELFSKMTVLDNLLLGSYLNPSTREETLEKVFELFPVLRERKNQIAGTLSGGEQQMLSIARSLMSNPKLLMLDEPSFGLAPMMVLKTFDTITRLNTIGVTILLVEQNIYHALELAHRGYVIENGRIVLEGESKSLLENKYIKEAYLGI